MSFKSILIIGETATCRGVITTAQFIPGDTEKAKSWVFCSQSPRWLSALGEHIVLAIRSKGGSAWGDFIVERGAVFEIPLSEYTLVTNGPQFVLGGPQ